MITNVIKACTNCHKLQTLFSVSVLISLTQLKQFTEDVEVKKLGLTLIYTFTIQGLKG